MRGLPGIPYAVPFLNIIMLVKQSKNSFIRIYDNGKLGYINNQLTRLDRSYDENGAIFLSELSRCPKDINDIFTNLLSIYSDVDKETLESDFSDFILDLESHKFVVTGDSLEEIEKKDVSFSYSFEKPGKSTYDYTQITKQSVDKTSENF